jgi:hypothetical protein
VPLEEAAEPVAAADLVIQTDALGMVELAALEDQQRSPAHSR